MDFLLLHGTTQAAVGYALLGDALTAHGHRVVAVDLPDDRPDWLAADYAEDVAAGVRVGGSWTTWRRSRRRSIPLAG